MSKKQAKPTASAPAAPKKRPRLRLAVMALAPLLLAGGGGYAGWSYYLGADAEAAAHDATLPPPIPVEIAAETSFTHSFAVATIIARNCGSLRVPALKAASAAEARVDGTLANLSWQAAARRTFSLDEVSCRHFISEIRVAEAKAESIAEAAGKSAKTH